MSPAVRTALLLGLIVYFAILHSFRTGAAEAGSRVAGLETRIAAVAKHPEAVPLPSSQEVARLHQELAAARAARADARFGILALNCAAMWALFYLLLWPLARGVIDRGIEQVAEARHAAQLRLERAEEALAEAEAKLTRIDDEVAALREREAKAGESEAAHLRELAQIEAKQVVEHAEQGMRREGELAEARVLRKIADAAVERALAEIGSDIDEATRKRLNKDLVEGLCA